MASYELTQIEETRPLVEKAIAATPNWVSFAADDPKVFQGLVYHLIHSPHTPLRPLPQLGRNAYVIEWWRPDSTWRKGLSGAMEQPTARGGYLGRIRFRTPGGAR